MRTATILIVATVLVAATMTEAVSEPVSPSAVAFALEHAFLSQNCTGVTELMADNAEWITPVWDKNGTATFETLTKDDVISICEQKLFPLGNVVEGPHADNRGAMLDATSGTVTLYGAFGLLYENKLPCSIVFVDEMQVVIDPTTQQVTHLYETYDVGVVADGLSRCGATAETVADFHPLISPEAFAMAEKAWVSGGRRRSALPLPRGGRAGAVSDSDMDKVNACFDVVNVYYSGDCDAIATMMTANGTFVEPLSAPLALNVTGWIAECESEQHATSHLGETAVFTHYVIDGDYVTFGGPSAFSRLDTAGDLQVLMFWEEYRCHVVADDRTSSTSSTSSSGGGFLVDVLEGTYDRSVF